MICNYFLPLSRLYSHFVDWFFCRAEAFYFDAVSLVYFIFVACTFGIMSKKLFLRPIPRSLSCMFSSRSFMVFDLTFKSLIYLELVFVSGIRERYKIVV